MRSSTCIVAHQPENLLLSQQACDMLRNTMYNLGMLLGGPPRSAASAATAAAAAAGTPVGPAGSGFGSGGGSGSVSGWLVQECGGLEGVVLLGLYLHVLLLLVVPCLAVYLIELNMKLSFIQTHGLALQHTWAIMDSRLIKAVVGYAAVVGGWMACEVAVLAVAPLQCNASGLLTWALALPGGRA